MRRAGSPEASASVGLAVLRRAALARWVLLLLRGPQGLRGRRWTRPRRRPCAAAHWNRNLSPRRRRARPSCKPSLPIQSSRAATAAAAEQQGYGREGAPPGGNGGSALRTDPPAARSDEEHEAASDPEVRPPESPRRDSGTQASEATDTEPPPTEEAGYHPGKDASSDFSGEGYEVQGQSLPSHIPEHDHVESYGNGGNTSEGSSSGGVRARMRLLSDPDAPAGHPKCSADSDEEARIQQLILEFKARKAAKQVWEAMSPESRKRI